MREKPSSHAAAQEALHKKLKRQWGTEKRTTPLSIVHTRPSVRKVTLNRVGIVLTIVFWVLYLISTILRQFFEGPQTYTFTLQSVGYVIVVTLLTFSALMYLTARQGALQRFAKHVRVPRAKLDRYFSVNRPSITVLIPSYSEEVDVIRKTMLSAALQEYPSMRIVLLLDDNPYPLNPAVEERLDATRQLAREITELLEPPATRFKNAQKRFQTKYSGKNAPTLAVKQLADEYLWAADWLEMLAVSNPIEDHVDIFFTNHVIRDLASDLRLIAKALGQSISEKAAVPRERVEQLYNRLVWTFSAELSFFERKRYASLSHEANKAMNINSYIGLMGHDYRVQQSPDGPVLIPQTGRQKAELIVPDSEFLLTLDADSILLREYCLRLVYFMGQPGNERVAVTQTPYSSFRGATSRIERLAGATTDLQHILHQGKTWYNATFWVGANAIIRKNALEDIVETEWIGGFEIKRYIQDRTVIEDTESSIDLTLHDWQLINYPERLSYSATPPDFGSLIVQRRRWANGGLLIMPKLFKRIRTHKRQHRPVSYIEVLLRTNYMSSIAWASFGLIFLLAFPYDSRLLSPLVLLAALPYFLAMASDLHYTGYKRSDIFRIYGFNLILLPVNLAGVLKSIEQAMTGKKISFARTPKVKNRTRTPLIYILIPIGIFAFSIFTFWRDYNAENWANAAFAAFNAILMLWAFLSYLGIMHTISDIWHGLTAWMFVEPKVKLAQVAQTGEALDWRNVLYHGDSLKHSPLEADDFIERVEGNPVIVPTKGSKAPQQPQRLSFWRLTAAIMLTAGITAISVMGLREWRASTAVASIKPWFAPYVDVTAAPQFDFEQLGATSTKELMLAFIVSSPKDGCTPTWGAAYTMQQASESLDLDRRIARLQQQKGGVGISFGGLLNKELSVGCTDDVKLLGAYSSVVEHYNIDTIDLDIESDNLTNHDANARRAKALAALQQQRRSEGKTLAIWLTLPVTPLGLSEDGTNAISSLIEGGVDLAGVNAMTMDYGESRPAGQSMASASISALQQTQRQLGILYDRAGTHQSDVSLWRKIGATPMVGQNDIKDEVFNQDDAKALNSFAHSQGIGRMSMWSANRDIQCGENYVNLSVVSDSCSGISQDKYAFMTILSENFTGDMTANARTITEAEPTPSAASVADDPKTSPYQIWSESGTYLQGTKVVWHKNVYRAKWWTHGDTPDNPVLQSWETPWELIGPVLPGEQPISQPTLPAGTYPEWSGDTAYDAKQRVLFQGVPYQAKWWNRGESPAAASSNPNASPWVPLTQTEINKIVEQNK